MFLCSIDILFMRKLRKEQNLVFPLKYSKICFHLDLILYPMIQHFEVLPRILAITKFRDDNQTSLQQRVLQFEAQLTALDIEVDRWKQMLLFCTEASAFTALSIALAANEDMTYEELTAILTERFSAAVTA